MYSFSIAQTTQVPKSYSLQKCDPGEICKFNVYRAINSEALGGTLGDNGKKLENTNTASAAGVLAYIHFECISPGQTEEDNPLARHHGIDAIAVFEVYMQAYESYLFTHFVSVQSSDPPSKGKVFGPYHAIDAGLVEDGSNRVGLQHLKQLGPQVGLQTQSNTRTAYGGDWHSFIGKCPNSEWVGGYDGDRKKPDPCKTDPAFDAHCTGEYPNGSINCQYTYKYLGYVSLDDFVGITSTTAPKCVDSVTGKPRPCTDYEDFRKNGNTSTDSNGYHIEYEGGGDDPADCSSTFNEFGLSFWKGRCNHTDCDNRAKALGKYPGKGYNLKQNPPSKGGN